MKFFKFMGLGGLLTYFVIFAFQHDLDIGIMSLIYSILYVIGAIEDEFNED